MGAYLSQKAAIPPSRPTKEMVSSMEVSESPEFKFPFRVFVSSLSRILLTSGVGHTHEMNWPLASWHEKYSDIKNLVDSGELAQKPALKNLWDAPIFIHVGKASPGLIP